MGCHSMCYAVEHKQLHRLALLATEATEAKAAASYSSFYILRIYHSLYVLIYVGSILCGNTGFLLAMDDIITAINSYKMSNVKILSVCGKHFTAAVADYEVGMNMDGYVCMHTSTAISVYGEDIKALNCFILKNARNLSNSNN
uniref:Uncharacterized protein n=1 Tax=Glossina palpalis gambiensis TaxID=67801 RepID=A0A1B0B5H9_9MUSC